MFYFLDITSAHEEEANASKHFIAFAPRMRIFVTLKHDDDLHLQQKQPSILWNGSGLAPRTSKLTGSEGTSFNSPLKTTSTLSL